MLHTLTRWCCSDTKEISKGNLASKQTTFIPLFLWQKELEKLWHTKKDTEMNFLSEHMLMLRPHMVLLLSPPWPSSLYCIFLLFFTSYYLTTADPVCSNLNTPSHSYTQNSARTPVLLWQGFPSMLWEDKQDNSQASEGCRAAGIYQHNHSRQLSTTKKVVPSMPASNFWELSFPFPFPEHILCWPFTENGSLFSEHLDLTEPPNHLLKCKADIGWWTPGKVSFQ